MILFCFGNGCSFKVDFSTRPFITLLKMKDIKFDRKLQEHISAGLVSQTGREKEEEEGKEGSTVDILCGSPSGSQR